MLYPRMPKYLIGNKYSSVIEQFRKIDGQKAKQDLKLKLAVQNKAVHSTLTGDSITSTPTMSPQGENKYPDKNPERKLYSWKEFER